MTEIGLGILGFAHGHVGMYCNRWREHPEYGVRVVAGWDHNAARAADNCKNQGIENVPSTAALLKRPEIGAVVITAETSLHAELVELAAAAGKAIVLQKPMALTMAEAERIVAAVKRAGVPFTMAWQMRCDPHNLQVKSLLQGGEFGRVFMVRRRHCLPTQHFKEFDKTWHVKPELNRDIFADDAAHPIDFIYWLLGMPESVTAEMTTALNPKVPNDNAIVVFRYPNGLIAEVSCTFVAVAGENVTEVTCENGVIIGNYGDVPSCNVPRPPGAGPQLKWYFQKTGAWTASDLPEIKSHGERIAGLAGPIAEFLHGKRPAIATAEEGRDVLRLVLACYESAGQGRRTTVR
ncbi:MAG: Gfo/Idh/MocA family oxidoreductase [Planctomycetota bacterium]|nr:Gfo/Idh/MocA family oxidoreductase [Planctomycetota bacterium]